MPSSTELLFYRNLNSSFNDELKVHLSYMESLLRPVTRHLTMTALLHSMTYHEGSGNCFIVGYESEQIYLPKFGVLILEIARNDLVMSWEEELPTYCTMRQTRLHADLRNMQHGTLKLLSYFDCFISGTRAVEHIDHSLVCLLDEFPCGTVDQPSCIV